jgi:hypothetical protein
MDFRRLLTLVLQARPTPRLEADLYEKSGGQPGLGCKLARDRLRSGRLSWTPDGVDAPRHTPLTARIGAALAVLPMTFLAFLDGLAGGTLMKEDRSRAHHHPVVVTTTAAGGPGGTVGADGVHELTTVVGSRTARIRLAVA